MKKQTINQLEFDAVRDKISQKARGQLVAEELSRLEIISDESLLQSHLTKVDFLMGALEKRTPFPLREYHHIKDSLTLLGIEGTQLSPLQVFNIGNIFEQSRLIKLFFQANDADKTSPWLNHYQAIGINKEIEKRILETVDAGGNVLDSASSQLRRIRRQIASYEQKIRKRMDELTATLFKEGILQDPQATVKGGRLVLPVKTSAKRSVKGVLTDISNTGSTTFIEPYEIIEMSNQIKVFQNEEVLEIERILKEITAQLSLEQSTIIENYKQLETVDFHAAIALYGMDVKSIIPELKRRHIKIIQGRNPILEAQRKVVPLDLELSTDEMTLVITGPNAGGKTVALKTAGLLTLMANSGIPIPADNGSILPRVDAIHTDIGDQQSILNDLSTFSAHMESIVRITENATENSLILLDELGTGTDPNEGAALAEVLLNFLNDAGCMTIATTHLGSLKVVAHEQKGFANGSMDFDQKNLRPSYLFRKGIPGSSYGLEIARRMGLKQSIIDEAKSKSGSPYQRLENLIGSLEKSLQENEHYKTELEMLHRKAKSVENEKDALLKDIQKEQKKAKQIAQRHAEELLAKTRKKLEQTIRDIKDEQASAESIKSAKDELIKVNAQWKTTIYDQEKSSKVIKENEFFEGMRVKIVPLDINGTILDTTIKKGKINVDAQGKRMTVPLEWLEKGQNNDQEHEDSVVLVNRSPSTGMRLDIRGKRADEAIELIEQFVDNATLSNLDKLEVIHGKGTGVLQKIVSETLSAHRGVKKFALGGFDEGGAGITYIELRV